MKTAKIFTLATFVLVLRFFWSRLPRGFRNFVRSRLEAFFPCKISPARPLAKGDIVVGGFLGTASGLGQGARWMLGFFRSAGLPVHGANFSKLTIIEEDFEAGPLWPPEASSGGIAILHMNPSLFPLGAYQTIGKARLASRRVVGYWAWELGIVPRRWQLALDALDEIWVPSHFVADAIKQIAPQKPVYVVPALVDVETYPTQPTVDPLPQFAGRTVVFFMYDVGSTHARKNPCAVVEAFKKASVDHPDATLVIKINNGPLWPESVERVKKAAEGMANVLILQEIFSTAMMRNLLARIDIAVSLHRSEGFGLLMAEAMAAGKPVIATGWSGNLDFMNNECSVLVDYKLVPVEDPQHLYDKYDAPWAEPDVDQAAQALRRLLGDPAERQRLGQAARRYVQSCFARQTCLRLLPESFWQSLEDPTWRARLSGGK